MVQNIRIEDFSYDLPESQIALHPLEKRDECRLLLRTPEGRLYHRNFKELPGLLPPGCMVVCNDTKVINARMIFYKESGAAIEIFLLEPLMPADYALNFQSKNSCRWKCLVGNLKKWKGGEIIIRLKTSDETSEESLIELKAKRIRDLSEGGCEIEFLWDADLSFGALLETAGKIPIPPYLNREAEESDVSDYQTIYAEVKGSVAAPTAGLHFTPEVFEDMSAHSITVEKLTLHVGAGTFKPVKSETIGGHDMHSESFIITRHLVERLIDQKLDGNRVVAVGTTSVRTLESLPFIGNSLLDDIDAPLHLDQWMAYKDDRKDFDTIKALEAILTRMDRDKTNSLTASTAIMIAPGFRWRITDIMVTNFHQPQSTLLLLVSSFLGGATGKEPWRLMYEEALEEAYRFLSYGDACLLFRGNETDMAEDS